MPLTLRIESELDERSATAAADRAQRIYTNAAQDMSRSLSEGLTQGAREGGRAVEDMADKARVAYKRVGDATDELRDQERQLKQMREDGARGVEVQAERVRRARRQEKEAIKEAADAYEQYERAARGAGDAGEQAGQQIMGGLRGAVAGAGQSGEDMASDFVGGFAGSSALLRLGAAGGPIGLALAGVAALGVTAGKVLADNIEAGLRNLQVQDIFQARLGADEGLTRRAATAAGQAYADAWGASVEDNLRAAQFAIQGGLIDRDATDADIQGAIEGLQALATTMNVDVQEAARAAGQLMRGGFAQSADEAFDVITSGFQDGLDISGDWLDTITEYSTQFRKLGIDGPDALGLIHQGLEGAARDSDIVADSLKEFSIRAVDGSKDTAEAFEALGFNADEMAQRFAAGGPTAREAFGAVLQALREIDDPLQQQLVWVRLFGTQFEDMGDAVNKLDLSTARGEFDQMQGSAQRMKDTMGEHISQWDLLGRNIDNTMSKLQNWLADSAVGRFFSDSLPTYLNDILANDPTQLASPPPAVSPDNLTPRDKQIAAGGGMQDLYRLPKNMGGLGPNPGEPGYQPYQPPSPTTPTATPSTPPPPLAATPGHGLHWEDGKGWVVDAQLPPGVVAPGPPPPTRGPGTPIVPDSAGTAGGPKLPDAPVVPFDGSLPGGIPGVSRTASIYGAESSFLDARHGLAEKQARLNQLEQSNEATADDIQNARNDVLGAERDFHAAEMRLSDAWRNEYETLISAHDKYTKQLAKGTDAMGELGAKIDEGFGISEGLSGIADNLVRFLASLAFAPVMGALAGVRESFGGTRGGSGLLGGISGMFAPQGPAGGSLAGGGMGNIALPPGTQLPGMSGLPSLSGIPGLPGGGGGQPYGLPKGTDIRQGAAGFPPWVYQMADAFGLQASTYAGHQEGSGQNRGIDWWGPPDNMAAFADYLAGTGMMEQVIYQDPRTGRKVGVAGGQLVGPGTSQPGYYANDFGDHTDHVHTRQSTSIPVPGAPAGSSMSVGADGATSVAPQWSADWNAIAQGESGGNWGTNTGNGYFGGLQFSPSSWAAAGGTQYAPSAELASPYQQAMVAENLLRMQGPGAWPNTFVPGSSGPAAPGQAPLGGPGGGGIPGRGGAPQAGPFGPNLGSITGMSMGGPAAPSQSVMGGRQFSQGTPASSGIGVGGGLIGLTQSGIGTAIQGAAGAGAMGANAGAPGAGAAAGAAGSLISAAAQIGIDELNRAIGAAGQYAGAAVGGIMETLSLNDSALADPGKSWFGRFAVAAAGMRPALSNTAGVPGGEDNPSMAEGGKPPPPLDPKQAAAVRASIGEGAAAVKGRGGNSVTNNINVTNQRATEDGTGRDIQRHLGAGIGARNTTG